MRNKTKLIHCFFYAISLVMPGFTLGQKAVVALTIELETNALKMRDKCGNDFRKT